MSNQCNNTEHNRMIYESLKDLNNTCTDIKEVQAKQAKDIEHHIARTDALEEMVKPVYRVYLQSLGIMKFMGIISLVTGVIYGIKQLF